MSKYWSVSGVYADEDVSFEGVMKEFDDEGDGDEDVLVFGVSEQGLREAVETGEPIDGLYVVHEFAEIEG